MKYLYIATIVIVGCAIIYLSYYIDCNFIHVCKI